MLFEHHFNAVLHHFNADGRYFKPVLTRFYRDPFGLLRGLRMSGYHLDIPMERDDRPRPDTACPHPLLSRLFAGISKVLLRVSHLKCAVLPESPRYVHIW
jgi:hypothetical protein